MYKKIIYYIIFLLEVENYATRLCFDLVLNVYSGWYFPSKDELNKLYINNNAIGGFSISGSINYLISSEYANGNAWFQDFNNGDQYGYNKTNLIYVRAIRSF